MRVKRSAVEIDTKTKKTSLATSAASPLRIPSARGICCSVTAAPPKKSKTPPKPRKTASVRAQRIGYMLRDHLTAEQAITEVAAAFEQAGGTPVGAAEILGVNYEQVRRWAIEQPALQTRIEAVQKRVGWVSVGRPKKVRRKRVARS